MVNPRITRREWRNTFLFALLIIAPLLTLFPVIQVDARQEKLAELLYRLDDTLYLANVTTGKTDALPDIKTASSDRWYWSPDGRYLLGNFTNSEVGEKRIRVYDVDKQHWIQDIHVGAFVSPVVWSSDSTQIAYAKPIGYEYDELWVYDLKTNIQRELYQTKHVTGNIITDTGISSIWWSPDDQFLLFNEYFATAAYMSNVNINLISADSKIFNKLESPYEGSNSKPIWSPDSKWFLLNQRKSSLYPFDPNYKSDLIMYGINDQIYLLTNTPNIPKYDIGWSADGKQIWFKTDTQFITIELQSVLNSSFDQPITLEQSVFPLPPKRQPLGDREYPSPDGQLIAFWKYTSNGAFDLYIAQQPDTSQVFKLANIKDQLDFLGWRPF